MPQFDPRPFRPRNNVDTLNWIRKYGSLEYRNRVPAATQANITETLSSLWEDRSTRNEMIDALVNRIGRVYVRSISWNNPLARFKQGLLAFGEKVEEVQMGLIKARTYDPRREYMEADLFGTSLPEVQSSFHNINRREFYPITVNESTIKQAFLEEGGLSDFLAKTLAIPSTSDEVDEFNIMTQLLKEFDDMGGFYNVQVADLTDLDSTSRDATSALRKLRTMIDTLPFVSTLYNPAGMPSFAKSDELVMFTTPEANAAFDVDALAGAFNEDRMRVASRQVIIPKERMPKGTQAILTTEDFFQVYDTVLENTSQPNAAGLTTNHFLHHQGIYSTSRFVPAIKFSTLPDTVIEISEPKVDSVQAIEVKDTAGVTVNDLVRGRAYFVKSGLNTTPAGSNEGVVLTLDGATSSYTNLDNYGGLVVGVDERAAALVIRAQASSEFVDDDSTIEPAVKTVTLSGDVAQLWPNPQMIPEAEAEADDETV
ncbi:major capsid protein [Curtobacterium phage Ayka]|nr:major capsid protein [Curtobacterium phage Ayka]